MRVVIIGLLCAAAIIPAGLAEAHGGGCRKASPPGQCCHMETATGQVHCHWQDGTQVCLRSCAARGGRV